MITGTKRRHLGWWLSLLLLCGLAFGLRVYQLDHFGLWLDEGATTVRANYSIATLLTNDIALQEGVYRDTHPPLHYLVIRLAINLWGRSDFGYRYVSVLASFLIVPLIGQLGRQIISVRTGIIAAFLTAISPLHIWYAQEARAYALIMLLTTLAAYVLWRAWIAGQIWRWLPIYLLIAVFSYYVNYTALLLLGVQGLFWLWLLWRQQYWRVVFAASAAALGIFVLAYLSGFEFALPYLDGEAPDSHIRIVGPILLSTLTGFSLGLTSDLMPELIDLTTGVNTLLLLVSFYWYQRPVSCAHKRRPGYLSILAWLLALPGGLALLTVMNPAYSNALHIRHFVVSSPAFLLLVAGGVTALPCGRPCISQFALLALIFVPSSAALRTMYNNPSFAKDDFRDLIWHIERKAGDRDVVLYYDPDLLALHNHYQLRSDLPYTALPIHPYRADADTELALAALAEEYDRVWFVMTPPLDGRDSERIVPTWLDNHLILLEQTFFHGTSALVGVTVYTGRNYLVHSMPLNNTPMQLQWGGDPTLVGVELAFDSPTPLLTQWVALFWTVDNPADLEDMLAHFIVEDAFGRPWLDEAHPIHLCCDRSDVKSSWHALSLPVGRPPGFYTIRFTLRPQEAGLDLDQLRQLAIFEAAPALFWLRPAHELTNAYGLHFVNGWSLVGISDSPLN
jgi:hypothetical protein